MTPTELDGQEQTAAQLPAALATQANEPAVEQAGTRPAPDSDGAYSIEIDPELVALDPVLQQLRAWTGVSKQEQAIDELARLIAEETQLQEATARETDSGYVLIAGHRRREAVIRLRREGTPTAQGGQFLLKVRVLPEVDDKRALRLAWVENNAREDFTDMEKARAIAHVIRPQFGWDGKQAGKSTAQVASFLAVSPATVTQLEKLLRLPEQVRADVQAGRLSAAAALDYTPVLDAPGPGGGMEAVAAVAEKARVKAEREAVREADKAAREADRLAHEARMDDAPELPAGTAKARLAKERADKAAAAARPENVRVKGRHVRAAVKEAAQAAGGPSVKQKAPRMSEAVEFWDALVGAMYPVACVKFAQAFSAWGHGKLKDAALLRAWDDVAETVTQAAGAAHDGADRRSHEAGVRRQAGRARKAVAAKKAVKPAAKRKVSAKPKAKAKARARK